MKERDQELETILEPFRKIQPSNLEERRWHEAVQDELAKTPALPKRRSYYQLAAAAALGLVIGSGLMGGYNYYGGFTKPHEASEIRFNQPAFFSTGIKQVGKRKIITAQALNKIPISGRDIIITDDQGYLWADHLQIEGLYAKITTYFGTISLSYYPFYGSQEMGTVKDNILELKISQERRLRLTSMTTYLPVGVVAKVYGIFNEAERSPTRQEPSVITSGSEETFLKKSP